jgi:integrase
MDGMPHPRMPHLHREVTRHGKVVWYARAGGSSRGPRVKLHADYGTSDFWAEYQEALASAPRVPAAPHEGTLASLLERYRETTAWTYLSAATRRQRENIFTHVLETAGKQPFAKITTATIMAGRDRRANTPFQARHFLDAMRGLFRWAVKARMIRVDPTAGVDNPPRTDGDGFLPWTEEHVAAYEERWPIGTRPRVWFDVLIYTGLRRGDAVLLGRPHVRNGIATMKTEKTGTEVTLPILPALAETLAAGPCGDLTFIAGENGRPLTKESFGNLFRKACRAAGVPGSAHGVRKIAATRAANAGATVAELEAIFGWQGGAMAALYTRAADRRRLAQGAMHKLARTAGEQMLPAPSGQTTRTSQKAKQNE